MRQIILVFCFLMPATLFAQTKKAELFRKFDSWQSVLETARLQKKNIFLDAFATWCGPCRQMDQEVYTNKSVSSYITANFIAIKVQMDQAKNDLHEVRRWYKDAQMLMDKYPITAFPCYVFISPDGQLIDISEGYQTVPVFLKTLRDANDLNKSFHGQLLAFKADRIPAKDLLKLAVRAKEYKLDSVASEIALAYRKNYLDKKQIKAMVDTNFLELISNFPSVYHLGDPLIDYAYQNKSDFDNALKKSGTAQSLADYYITVDLVFPILAKYSADLPMKEPNWADIEQTISAQYDANTAKRIVIGQKIGYFSRIKDYESQVKYEFEKIQTSGLDTAGLGRTAINNLVYDVIFQHVNNPVYLKKSIDLMEQLLAFDPERAAWVDTYANILYKAGDEKKGITYQEKALELAKKSNNTNFVSIFSEKLKKMKAGQPTWEVERK